MTIKEERLIVTPLESYFRDLILSHKKAPNRETIGGFFMQ